MVVRITKVMTYVLKTRGKISPGGAAVFRAFSEMGKHTVGDQVCEAVNSIEDDTAYSDISSSVPQFINSSVSAPNSSIA